MPVASVIVEVDAGSCEAVLRSLAGFENVSVFGVKDCQIVAVIVGDDLGRVGETIGRLQDIEKVRGVYPVFAGSD